MVITVRIKAQYIDENGKMKGGREFNVQMDSDYLMYADSDVLAKVFQNAINATMTGWAGEYIYLEHEPLWFDAIELDGVAVAKAIDDHNKALQEERAKLLQEFMELAVHPDDRN